MRKFLIRKLRKSDTKSRMQHELAGETGIVGSSASDMPMTFKVGQGTTISETMLVLTNL